MKAHAFNRELIGFDGFFIRIGKYRSLFYLLYTFFIPLSIVSLHWKKITSTPAKGNQSKPTGIQGHSKILQPELFGESIIFRITCLYLSKVNICRRSVPKQKIAKSIFLYIKTILALLRILGFLFLIRKF